MELPARRFPGALVLSPAGRIGHDAAEAFRHALQAQLGTCVAGQDAVVLDMSSVEYVSSAALRALLLAAREAKAHGGTLVMAALTPAVREIFEISRFTVLFRVFATVPEALAEVAPAAVAAYEARRAPG